MKTLLFALTMLAGSTLSFAQCKGKEFLRLADLENLLIDDSIAPIKTYRGALENSGYKVGDRVLDYTFTGTESEMAMMASGERPKLLIAGSYTCPVFRNQAAFIDSLYAKYKERIEVYIVYTVDAHPDVDPCPYRDSIWITEQNIQENILFAQPRTYDQRLRLARTMKDAMKIKTPVLVDNSNNDYWMHFGPAPNNAYLLDKNGIVLAKNVWLDRTIVNDIEAMLQTMPKEQ